MPEGHTIHRLANTMSSLFAGQVLEVTSPQGRFDAGARLLTGRQLTDAEAWGKRLFLSFSGDEPLYLHTHLGLYGSWTFAGDGELTVAHAIGAPRLRMSERENALPGGAEFPPPPRGQVRVRLMSEHAVADVTGPTVCEVIDAEERARVIAKLGPDPIRGDAVSARFVGALKKRRMPVGAALMDQSIIAGVGNIYRAEVLFRAGLDPLIPSAEVSESVARRLWDDLVLLMRQGAATGRIVTTVPSDRGDGESAPRGPRQNTDLDADAVPSSEAFYVYHRDGRPCRLCGTPIGLRELSGRKLYWCPTCQRGKGTRPRVTGSPL
ncbi:formamidopyrimidine-DNA glycosylase [Rarobacter faecitabidus]|uniref:DNA-(apurinic or apyrimidinic site) lyase n=1 Tax=Rarobacter faecitabidus TaxID=13243 RepID=A0A542ZWJ8_RARFA|nr:DNA-formamidopyrimidine glycosylase family protein [Rarobacter faecitabidus]TQL64735.1 endonuclease-8/formamidopyrimidine-DNA glycosylase [Rarobacter faecitabidus]